MTKSFRHLLDTNILSDLVRQPQGAVARRIAEAGEETSCTSIIVAAELRFSAEKSGSIKLGDQVDLILSAIEISLWNHLQTGSTGNYATIWHAMVRQSDRMTC